MIRGSAFFLLLSSLFDIDLVVEFFLSLLGDFDSLALILLQQLLLSLSFLFVALAHLIDSLLQEFEHNCQEHVEKHRVTNKHR